TCSKFDNGECLTWKENGNYKTFYNVHYPFLLEINYNDTTKAAFPKNSDYAKFYLSENDEDYINENYLLNLSGYVCF
ncbi:MAG: hypothetical protein QXQ79_02245, partial [Candidatus Nanoarchaeia archaeon]